jgi:hypothetical protein
MQPGGNNSVKWVIGLLVTILIAVAGWGVGSFSNLTRKINETSERTSKLEVVIPNIDRRLTDIYDLLTRHMGIK